MGTSFVNACYQQSNAIRTLAVVLRVGLCTVADGGDEAFERNGTAVGEAAGERLLLHEVGEDSGVGC